MENTHRAGLTTAEEVGVAGQLAAFGLTVNQFTRRTRTKRAHVAQAVAVAESDLAAMATARYGLTLEQAATLAEFDDNPDTVKALVAAVKAGQFDHAAQRARDDRAQVAPYDRPWPNWPTGASRSWPNPSGTTPGPRHHAAAAQRRSPHHRSACRLPEPGRVRVRVARDWDSEQWGPVVEVCTDYRVHEHTAPTNGTPPPAAARSRSMR